MNHLPPPHSDATGAGKAKIYHVGTLTYTKAALVMLFFWLIWGDFCYTVMESVTGPIMQLKFKALHASNTEIAFLLSALPGTVYSLLNPVISYKSDRFRSRWGRRIPFILFSLPFLLLGLVALAYGEQIGLWLHGHLGFLLKGVSAGQVTILTFGALLVLFTPFNTFVTTTFWYLFNDVVPEHLLARFMAWIRVISILSTSLYWYLIFPYSSTHSTETFLGASLLYLAGIGLLSLNVKEGGYPPRSPYIEGRTDPLAAVTTFARETHAFPHYWYLWICTFIGCIGNAGSIVGSTLFGLYFCQKLGLNADQYGAINGSLLIAMGIMTVGAGWLADRYHPIRVVIIGIVIGLFIVPPVNLIWLFWHPSPHVAYWVILLTDICLAAPGAALGGMWDPPMLMRLFPRMHFGQFCSTNAVWRTAGGIVGGVLTGAFLDWMTRWVGEDRAYFYLPLWGFLFGVPSFLLFLKLYQSWKRHGGDDAYLAPVLETLQPVPISVNPVSVPSSDSA